MHTQIYTAYMICISNQINLGFFACNRHGLLTDFFWLLLLVTPPFMGNHIFTDRLAFAAADWCLRLHGWPIMPPLLGIYDFTAGLPPSPPSGVFAYTAGLLCRRCWASTTSPPACLRRRRVVPPRLAYYA